MKAAIQFLFALLLLNQSAFATGYYNQGGNWHGRGRMTASNIAGPSAGTGDGMLTNPRGVTTDSLGNIYVADSNNHRISKFNSSGVFQGWIGKILTSPTGGATGCSGATVGSATPGWCKGGTSTNGTGDGMLYKPEGIVVDASGNIYVAEYSNNRISKFSSDGAFQGWTGGVASSPTGGASGCIGASGATPGWCTGGTSAAGTGNGILNGAIDLAIDTSGNLYVSDYANHRISKYSSLGAFQGWIGRIGTSPTGGATGCNGAAVNSVTPGWCTGGTSVTGTGDGMLNNPFGIALDSSGNIYVADSNNNRVSKYNSLGVFQGWIGKILTSPTGGASGCSGAAVGSVTPGWCTAGTAQSGSTDGTFNYPAGVAVDSTGSIYVADSNNSRISKYNSSGAFQGWLGGIATSPTGGATACNGAAVGNPTPGSCTGGSAQLGTGTGMVNFPGRLAVDSAGNLFIADSNNNRIVIYKVGPH